MSMKHSFTTALFPGPHPAFCNLQCVYGIVSDRKMGGDLETGLVSPCVDFGLEYSSQIYIHSWNLHVLKSTST